MTSKHIKKITPTPKTTKGSGKESGKIKMERIPGNDCIPVQ